MKNKKNRFAFIIVALILFLGVGYAVVTSTNLSITGTATVESSSIDVEFDKDYTPGATYGSTNVGSVIATGTNGTANANGKYLSATIDVAGLKAKGDTTTVTYQVINHEEFAALLTEVSTSVDAGEDAYYTVTTDIGDGKTIAAGETTTVAVTVTLDHLPVTSDESTTAVTVNLLAEPSVA